MRLDDLVREVTTPVDDADPFRFCREYPGDPIVLGITGTQDLTLDLMVVIAEYIAVLPKGSKVVQGGCVGVDAYAALVAHRRGFHVHTIFPANKKKVDPKCYEYSTTYEEMPEGTDYRARNEMVVLQCTKLVAFARYPEDDTRSKRSGTWMTKRIAQRAGKFDRSFVSR